MPPSVINIVLLEQYEHKYVRAGKKPGAECPNPKSGEVRSLSLSATYADASQPESSVSDLVSVASSVLDHSPTVHEETEF